ncbi:MAG: hypothetical protein GY803_18560, partial [Chloroflexi bacterium]|nr:hypothetical protein [Chloroflexota bacterium]
EMLMADFDAVGLQKAGGKITAVFRYQMLTGQALAPQFFHQMHQKAQAEGTAPSQVFGSIPIPSLAARWHNGGKVKG